MSRYTVQLRFLLENPDWTDARLGLADYPIFDESYRNHLNYIIKEYFYFDEIGYETPARFAMKLRNKMAIIMPYFNQLYSSALIDIDPMINMRHVQHSTSLLKELSNAIKNSVGQNNKSNTGTATGTVGETSLGNTVTDKHTESVSDRNSIGSSLNSSESNKRVENVDEITSNGTHSGSSSDSNISEETVHSTSDSLSVTSDTPEGFLLTSKIEDSTYANNATKTNQDEETVRNGSTTKTGSTSDTTTDRKVDNFTGNDSSNETQNENRVDVSHDKTDGKEIGSTIDSKKSDTVSENKTVFDEDVQDLLNVLENAIKNVDTETTVSYDGFNGITMSEMLLKWRDTFINIDMMILNQLEGLFIGVLN